MLEGALLALGTGEGAAESTAGAEARGVAPAGSVLPGGDALAFGLSAETPVGTTLPTQPSQTTTITPSPNSTPKTAASSPKLGDVRDGSG